MHNIDKNQLKKEGFLLQMNTDQYLLASGPFSIHFRPSLSKWSLFHPFFFLSEFRSWYLPSSTAFFSRGQLLAFLENQNSQVCDITADQWQSPSFSVFKDFFLKTQKQIKQNKIQKVVPVFFETTDYFLNPGDILALIHRLISRSGGETTYAYWSDRRTVIGATPEYLFRKKGRYVQTMALAGTARHSRHNLLEDPKEQWEHQLVVDEMKILLATLGEYRFSDTYIYATENMRHLRTDFNLRLKSDLSFEKLCCLLHPTPALGGSPRKEALNLLAELQRKHHLRYGFGAPFGVSMGHEAFCVVAIRNIQFMDGKAYIGSGCGLVKESIMEREWDELKQKRQFIKNILLKNQ